VQLGIVASKQHHEIEVAHWEELAAVELEQQSTLVDLVVLFNEVKQLVVVELWYVEFLVP